MWRENMCRLSWASSLAVLHVLAHQASSSATHLVSSEYRLTEIADDVLASQSVAAASHPRRRHLQSSSTICSRVFSLNDVVTASCPDEGGVCTLVGAFSSVENNGVEKSPDVCPGGSPCFGGPGTLTAECSRANGQCEMDCCTGTPCTFSGGGVEPEPVVVDCTDAIAVDLGSLLTDRENGAAVTCECGSGGDQSSSNLLLCTFQTVPACATYSCGPTTGWTCATTTSSNPTNEEDLLDVEVCWETGLQEIWEVGVDNNYSRKVVRTLRDFTKGVGGEGGASSYQVDVDRETGTCDLYLGIDDNDENKLCNSCGLCNGTTLVGDCTNLLSSTNSNVIGVATCDGELSFSQAVLELAISTMDSSGATPSPTSSPPSITAMSSPTEENVVMETPAPEPVDPPPPPPPPPPPTTTSSGVTTKNHPLSVAMMFTAIIPSVVIVAVLAAPVF